MTLVWSITSGKRLILCDGQEVHYSSSRSGMFDHSWTMRGNHVLKVVAHASPPLSPTPGFRQYDFFVDGQTFFSFPKVYRLGLAPNDPRNAVSPSSPVRLADRGSRSKSSQIVSLEAPHNPDEEEAYLREAIKNSLTEQQKAKDSGAKPQISSQGQSLLLDFLEEPAPAPGPGGASMQALPPPDYGFAGPPQQNGYGGQDPYGYGAPQGGPGAMVPYGAPAPGGSQQQPYPGAPPPPQQQQYGHTPFDAPQPIQTAPTSVTPMAQASPSTLGFNSPQPDFAGFQSPAPPAQGNDYGYGGNQVPNQSYGGGDPFSQPPPQQQQSQYGGGDQFAQPPPQQQTQQYGGQQQPPQQQQQNQPFGGDQFAQPPAQQQQNQQYGSHDQFAQPPPQQQQNQQYGSHDQFAQPPPQQQQNQHYGGQDQFAQPPPQQQGGGQFAQPPQQQQDNFSVASGQQFDQVSHYGQQQQEQDQQQNKPSDASNGPALTMNSLQGQDQGLLGGAANGSSNKQGGSLADQAYAKFASMDQFDLISKKDTERANPFESQPVGQQRSLADMQKTAKVRLFWKLRIEYVY